MRVRMWGLVALIAVGVLVDCAVCVHIHRLPEARGYAMHTERETALD
jgi:hypothetical protein